jgi:hypothetical protein
MICRGQRLDSGQDPLFGALQTSLCLHAENGIRYGFLGYSTLRRSDLWPTWLRLAGKGT